LVEDASSTRFLVLTAPPDEVSCGGVSAGAFLGCVALLLEACGFEASRTAVGEFDDDAESKSETDPGSAAETPDRPTIPAANPTDTMATPIHVEIRNSISPPGA
jgi:hypothetical protein